MTPTVRCSPSRDPAAVQWLGLVPGLTAGTLLAVA
ncbi:hypothetical protein FHS08_000387 [Microbacterium ulmi]|nr:hypothetical protein [Microbacterium ulmi]